MFNVTGPDYNNYTRTDLEDFLLLAWSSFSFALGILGNILVLVASYRRGIHIDKTSLLVIKNLAVSDILFNLIWVLPTLITLLAGRWVLGEVVCHITTYLQYTTAIATICFITIFSINKYIRCKFPLKPWKITTARGYLITTASWTFAFVHPAMYFFSNLVREDVRRIMLYPPKSSCDYYHGLDLSEYWHRIDMLCAVMYTFIPTVALITVNVGLVRLVRQKGKQSFNKSNLTLILIITVVFFVSYAPYVVKYSLPIFSLQTDVLSNWFKALMNFMLYTNSWFNSFAYYSTNATFRHFTTCFFTCKPYRPRRASVVTSVIIENSTSVEAFRSRSGSLAPISRRSSSTTLSPNFYKSRSVSLVVGNGIGNQMNGGPRNGAAGGTGCSRRNTTEKWTPGSERVLELEEERLGEDRSAESKESVT